MQKGKKKYLIIAIVLFAIAISYLILLFVPRPVSYEGDNPLIVDSCQLPRPIAHRGGAGEYPENTLEAFYNAYSIYEGFILETDVNITKDGVLILCHETSLDDTTDRTGEIIDWNYTDLISERVNFGYKNSDGELTLYTNDEGVAVLPSSLPGCPEGLDGRDATIYLATTLEELLVEFPNSVISVEIKQEDEAGESAARELVRLVDEYDAFDRVILATYHSEVRDELQDALENIGEDGALTTPALASNVAFIALDILGLDALYDADVAAIHIPTESLGFDLATEDLIATAHKHNIAVHYHTVDDEETMLRLIEIGADGIMTDRPSVIIDLYSRIPMPIVE